MSTTSDNDRSRAQAQPENAPVGSGAHPSDSYGGAVSDEAPAAPVPGTQNAPVQDMHEASNDDKIAGIVAQTRQDVGNKDDSRIADVLRQRFEETGVKVADDRLAALVAEVANNR